MRRRIRGGAALVMVAVAATASIATSPAWDWLSVTVDGPPVELDSGTATAVFPVEVCSPEPFHSDGWDPLRFGDSPDSEADLRVQVRGDGRGVVEVVVDGERPGTGAELVAGKATKLTHELDMQPAGDGRYCDRFEVRFTRDDQAALSVEWQIEAGVAVDTYEVGDGIVITVQQ